MAQNPAIGLAAAHLHSARVTPNRNGCLSYAPLRSLTPRIQNAIHRYRPDLRLSLRSLRCHETVSLKHTVGALYLDISLRLRESSGAALRHTR